MNRTKLKNYAPHARRDFIQAITDRAAFYGLTAKKIEPLVERGDVAVIAGREHPRAIAKKRKQLEDLINRRGFEQTMEALAYTWFNRLIAMRFMELHGYLDHGYRVLSHPEGKPTPEILEHAEHVELPGLRPETVIDLKLAGNKEAELYRRLLTAQCNALHDAMPFLFEKIDDETELLLPDNLLHSDSLVRNLVSEIDEEDWQEVEIIGWLYQFYISEKKDEVIGKVVASEDIPAATQLFTPNWIVKYLVQNTLGRQWLATYPQSALRGQMEYYIEPAEQTPEVQEQLKAITPTSLNPEELTLLDPACGSGHILVEAYDLFKAIYQERGYRAKDIPALILQKNLFGLEIDDRAAQLAAFALMMKARANDRRIFESEAKPHIPAFQDSQGMNAADITHALNSPINKEEMPPSEYLFEEIENAETPLFSKKARGERGHVAQEDIANLLELFENAKTFGSLIRVPPKLAEKLPGIEQRLNDILKHGDLTQAPAHVITPLLQQARLLAQRYDAVATNPPYMGTGAMNPTLSALTKTAYPKSRYDLMTCFMQKCLEQTSYNGFMSMINQHSWMFLSRFEGFRRDVLESHDIECLAHLGPRAFPEISGEVVQSVAFTLRRRKLNTNGRYTRLTSFKTTDEKETHLHDTSLQHVRSLDAFLSIPGSILAYWASDATLVHLRSDRRLNHVGEARRGLQTGNAPRFIRYWFEVSLSNTQLELLSRDNCVTSPHTWFLFNNGGEFRKWIGNVDYVVNWRKHGHDIKTTGKAIIPSEHHYFADAITWSRLSGGRTAFRYVPQGIVPGDTGPGIFMSAKKLALLGYLNSVVANHFLDILVPGMTFLTGDIENIPVPDGLIASSVDAAERCVSIAESDWREDEGSWAFTRFPMIPEKPNNATALTAWRSWRDGRVQRFHEMQKLEEANNALFIEMFGLGDELRPAVDQSDITLSVANETEDIKRLLSYAIGCVMGRYSLDKPGLIYAHSANQGFDASKYKTFRSDDDGIIPLLETDWGIRDDATNRFVEFIGVAWPKEHLEENLKFIADSLGSTSNEQPRDAIRRYLGTGFYRHHLQTYKRRPIYWLFTSGKQRTFQCLVYLHRYHEGTLARMRNEYVIPLQGQIASRIEQLEGDKVKATSTSHRKKLQKEQDDLKKQQAELLTFEEKLKHAADQKISLDLDDGVKVNYAKFGDLLAEAKAITGAKDDE
jgi:N-6 DNA Methylase